MINSSSSANFSTPVTSATLVLTSTTTYLGLHYLATNSTNKLSLRNRTMSKSLKCCDTRTSATFIRVRPDLSVLIFRNIGFMVLPLWKEIVFTCPGLSVFTDNV